MKKSRAFLLASQNCLQAQSSAKVPILHLDAKPNGWKRKRLCIKVNSGA